jgi:hypothetical protein
MLYIRREKLLIPQITQTLWIIGLGVFHVITTLAVLKTGVWENGDTNWAEVINWSFNIGSYTAHIDKYWLYAVFSILYVILIFLVLYVTLGIKMSMVHQYIRSKGKEMGFWHGFKLVEGVGGAFWAML